MIKMVKIRTFSFSQSKKDIARINNIANIIVKFQVSAYVDKIMSKEKLPIHINRSRTSEEIKRLRPEEKVTVMFEELGTSFVKFGQLLSTREDIIGPDYAGSLAKLNDNMTPFPTQEAKDVIKEELGEPVNKLFASFEDKPLASASIAQVHRATLKNGKKVIVKVQRPGIEDTIMEDIRIMHYLAFLVDKNVPELRKYDPQYLVDEFERSIIKELDFTREAKNATRLRLNFKDFDGVYIPKVYEELSEKHVLTMEEIKGTKLANVIASHSAKFNKDLIAKRLVQQYLKMILTDGFYHADPHPGNIRILDHNVICFLDFGRCASIDKELAENIFKLVMFALNNDVKGMMSHLFRTGLLDESSNTNDLKADITDLLDAYYTPDIEKIKIGQLLSDLISIITKYDFNRPRELAELTRTLLILEGVGMQIDPEFNLAKEFEPYSKKYMSESVDTERLSNIIKGNLLDLEYMARDFPSTMRRLMKKIAQGRITLQLEHKNLEVITDDIREMSSTISVALIISALIVASSVIGLVDKPLGLIFFVASAAIGIWLVVKTLVL